MNTFYNYYLLQLKKYILQLLIPLIYFPFRRWKFVKFTLTFPACIFTIHNTRTSVAHFSYMFLIKTKFRFACVFWLIGNIKQPPLTPKLSTAYAGVDLTLPTMTSHGAYTSVCLTGADNEYIRVKETDSVKLDKKKMSVFFALTYFLSAPVRQTEV